VRRQRSHRCRRYGRVSPVERLPLLLVLGSFLLILVFLYVHPAVTNLADDLVVSQLSARGVTSEVILLIIAFVCTAVAPWQLFFQHSY
jgi:Mn2+/Fe2+ NRAMP family transporter